MILVVEAPHQADPSAWFAFDLDDLLRKIETRAPGLLNGAGAGADADADADAVAPSAHCRIYWSEAEAMCAFESADDPLWQGAGWRARLALRAQLIATEVLAGDR